MERMLQRIASQLGSYDEASLLSLWDKYHQEVKTFQPTRQWEESVLILCLLQAVRWKNQLFNSKWREQRSADFVSDEGTDREGAHQDEGSRADEQGGEDGGSRGRVIVFPSQEDDTP